jgi:ADP-heptose:LPS heptosyltransferase
LGNTSPEELAARALAACLRGDPPGAEIDELAALAASEAEPLASAASRALFRELVEPLADRFERRLCDAYAALFSRVIARVAPQWEPSELLRRYERVRLFRRFDPGRGAPEAVYVLSRVTLGADVAVTSVLLDAMKKRFPAAEIYLVGARKAWELFAGDRRIRHWPVEYAREGTLRERVAAGWALRGELDREGAIVVDPDSRLTQLGLLPVCREESYYFFESRAYGGDGTEPLSRLAMRWVAEVFGVADARPYVAPEPASAASGPAGIAVSLGVGGNLEKRVPDPFEGWLLRALIKKELPVLIDRGAGGEEAARVERALASLGRRARQVEVWDGSFAGFAARIGRSRLYVGYDSAGQHVAAACGVPLVSIFAGFASERAFFRWQPGGWGRAAVVRVDEKDPERVLRRTLAAVDRCLEQRGGDDFADFPTG